MKIITLRVSEEEQAAWAASAGDKSLSAWVRDRCNALPVETDLDEPVVVLNETVPPPRSRARKVYPLCKHGKEVGCFCIDCGGIAKMRVAVNV